MLSAPLSGDARRLLRQRQRLRVRKGRRLATAKEEIIKEGQEWLRFHQKRVVLGSSDWAERIRPPPVPVPRSVAGLSAAACACAGSDGGGCGGGAGGGAGGGSGLSGGSSIFAKTGLCASGGGAPSPAWPAMIPTIFRGPAQYEDLQETLLQVLWGRREGAIPVASAARANLRIWGGGFMIPHDEKRYRRGDDSWFCSEPLRAFGVCDGVGEMGDSEWRVAGFDCRGFGEDILREARQRVLSVRLSHQPVSGTRPRLMREPGTRRSQNRWVPVPYTVSGKQPSLIALDALISGYYEKQTTWGAATCLIGCLSRDGDRVGFANIGDSRAMLLRRGRFSTGPLTIVGATEPEQHGWNLPVQLARLPDRARIKEMRTDARLRELVRTLDACRATGQDVNDKPETATLFDFDVQEGDLVVVATDGLWDNLFDAEVASLCGVALSPLESRAVCAGSVFKSTAPRDIAKGLCLAAYWKSLHHDIDTPFSRSVRDAEGAGYHHLGGKRDDISVVCAWLVDAAAENNIHLLQRWRDEKLRARKE